MEELFESFHLNAYAWIFFKSLLLLLTSGFIATVNVYPYERAAQ